MDAHQIRSTLTDIFRQVFKDPALEISETMTAQDVPDWDSLNHLVLISAIEEQFKIKFKLKELLNIDNVGDLLRLVGAKVAPA